MRADVEVWRRRGIERWSSKGTSGLATWRHGALDAYCKCGDITSRGLEARCRPRDVEVLMERGYVC